MIYNACLVAHIIGITMMAGTTFIDYITLRRFWKTYAHDKAQGLYLENTSFQLQRFMGIGMLLIILSGIGMMVFMHQVWGQQFWFRVKMGMLLLVIINGLALRRRFGTKLRKLVTADAGEMKHQMATLRIRLTWAQSLQMLFFIIIFTLSVFKFN